MRPYVSPRMQSLGGLHRAGRAFLLLWNRLHSVFFIQHNLFGLLILFVILAVGIYAALKLLFSR
jgi:hypothetical protein